MRKGFAAISSTVVERLKVQSPRVQEMLHCGLCGAADEGTEEINCLHFYIFVCT